jgi:hypothetical protein
MNWEDPEGMPWLASAPKLTVPYYTLSAPVLLLLLFAVTSRFSKAG